MMALPFLLASGAFWVATYLLIIRRGWLDRTFGMPLVALCANLSWEFIFAFVFPQRAPQVYVNAAWFAFDLLILLELLRFGAAEFPHLPRRGFYGLFALALVVSFGAVLFVTIEFDDYRDGAYSAFGQNLMMSALFVDMLLRRRSVRGQSLYIALCKLIGTGLVSFAGWFIFRPLSASSSVLLPYLYVAIAALDALYVVLLYRQCRREGINPWQRL